MAVHLGNCHGDLTAPCSRSPGGWRLSFQARGCLAGSWEKERKGERG